MFDINYNFNIGDRFVALRHIEYRDLFIKKGTIITITSIFMNSIYKFNQPPLRRTDLRLDCYNGIFIYTNNPNISNDMPNWYHYFDLSDFATLKEYRKQKLKKLRNEIS